MLGANHHADAVLLLVFKRLGYFGYYNLVQVARHGLKNNFLKLFV
jgi:hypothetical protein